MSNPRSQVVQQVLDEEVARLQALLKLRDSLGCAEPEGSARIFALAEALNEEIDAHAGELAECIRQLRRLRPRL